MIHFVRVYRIHEKNRASCPDHPVSKPHTVIYKVTQNYIRQTCGRYIFWHVAIYYTHAPDRYLLLLTPTIFLSRIYLTEKIPVRQFPSLVRVAVTTRHFIVYTHICIYVYIHIINRL